MEDEVKGIKGWAEMDKPREKAISKGLSTLSDSELIAILLRTGTREESVVELSRKILQRVDNNLGTLAKMSVHQLQNGFKGIGTTKAITLLAALELGRRVKLNEALVQNQIRSSSDLFNIMMPMIAHLPHEEFWVVLLSRSNNVIDRVQISQGGVAGTVVDVKLIMKSALERLASSIIVCHNHPSGTLHPSEQDVMITNKIKEAAKCMDIVLMDHIIVTDRGYYSFADHEML